jgi:hypothetical protein
MPDKVIMDQILQKYFLGNFKCKIGSRSRSCYNHDYWELDASISDI